MITVLGQNKCDSTASVQVAIDKAIVPKDFSILTTVAMVWVGSLFLAVIISGIRIRFLGRLGQLLMYDLRVRVFSHLQRLSLDFFTEEKAGRLLTRMTSDIEASTTLALKDAAIAARCGCPIFLFSVAASNDQKQQSEKAIEEVRKALSREGYEVSGVQVELGDPVERIIEAGRKHSLIVLAATEKSFLHRMFLGSISHEVLKRAKNSVMIIR